MCSVQNALDRLGARYEIAVAPEQVEQATALILPGVGHFNQMVNRVKATGVADAVKAQIRRGTPYLGICLGMQALFERSEEAPDAEGFGSFRGVVRRLSDHERVPHIGWNEIEHRRDSVLFKGLGKSAYAYFAHSYAAPVGDECVASCNYGGTFSAALQFENIYGTQFHPEKSGALGLAVLANFIEAARAG